MAKRLPADYAIDAMAREVERRRKLPGKHQYSYGKLIADTTEESRSLIAEEYRRSHGRSGQKNTTTYQEPNDKEDLEKVIGQIEEETAE